jgi:hypothetical protein
LSENNGLHIPQRKAVVDSLSIAKGDGIRAIVLSGINLAVSQRHNVLAARKHQGLHIAWGKLVSHALATNEPDLSATRSGKLPVIVA